MKRILIAVAFLVWSVPASAQLTTMPIPLAQWFDNAGAVLDAGGFCVYRAGTTTLATTYTTAAGSVANANPILFNSAGRATTGGVFLTPGTSYKFVLKDFTGVVSPTCVPDTGVTIWTVDNISAAPASSVNIDVPGTAGVSFTAGELAYISDGSGALTAGSWYKTDADFPYASTLPQIGFAVTDITSGSAGSFRLVGRQTGLTALTPGTAYYISATPGALTSTAPANVRVVGEADSATTLVFGMPPILATVDPRIKSTVNGRLSLTTGVPITTSNVTAATTIYWALYNGNSIGLYTGSTWTLCTLAQLSMTVPSTTNTMYDVFLDYNDGCSAAVLTALAWTNDTTRATALTTQDGINVKTGDTQQRYLGSFRTTAVSGQTESSLTTRYLANAYNCVGMPVAVVDAQPNWTYTTATVRQARGSTANQINVVVGLQGVNTIDLTLTAIALNDSGNIIASGIGRDSTTTFTQGVWTNGGTAMNLPMVTHIAEQTAIGRHFYSWNESSTAAGTTTWYGSNTVVGGFTASGMAGTVCQ